MHAACLTLKVLTEGQIVRLHQAALDVLAEVGAVVPHEETLGRFTERGAHVDLAEQRVRIPEDLVRRCLQSAGKQFTVYGRDRARRAEFGMGKRNYNSIAGEALWIDDETGERRYATLADVASAARLCDALGHINLVGAMADPHDVPVAWRCAAVAATQLRNTTKPIHFWFHDRPSARYVLEVFAAVAGSQADLERYPFAYAFLEPISPLRFARNGVDLLYETARMSVPVAIGPMAQTGMSAPGTLAGTLVQEHAEILAGVCVTQLVREGLAVMYGGIPHAFDMGTTQMIFAGPEQALMAVAMTQMGKWLGLPVYINVGLTDSKCVDAQAGLEAGTTLAYGAAAGADIFGHLGICGVDQAASLDMLVMQHEIIGYVERLMRGIEISDEALGLDVIRSVGPGGAYVDQMHTVKHFRKELWFPSLLDRQYYQAWVDGGRSQMSARCRAQKEHLLATHGPAPLPEDVDRQVTKVLDRARQDLA